MNLNVPFYTCEVCGVELANKAQQKAGVDERGFTHSFCNSCFASEEKRKQILGNTR